MRRRTQDRTWEESTKGMTPEQKVLHAFEWAAGMAQSGSAWDKAMQETRPTLHRIVAQAVSADLGFCGCTDDGVVLTLCRVHRAAAIENDFGSCEDCTTARLVESWEPPERGNE